MYSVKNMDLQSGRPEFQFYLWSWEGYLSTLILSFTICRIDILTQSYTIERSK